MSTPMFIKGRARKDVFEGMVCTMNSNGWIVPMNKKPKPGQHIFFYAGRYKKNKHFIVYRGLIKMVEHKSNPIIQ